MTTSDICDIVSERAEHEPELPISVQDTPPTNVYTASPTHRVIPTMFMRIDQALAKARQLDNYLMTRNDIPKDISNMMWQHITDLRALKDDIGDISLLSGSMQQLAARSMTIIGRKEDTKDGEDNPGDSGDEKRHCEHADEHDEGTLSPQSK